ncbi:hypothetical protein PT974_09612 [Cladobotryum mycophilum]|uniref:Uncharacterized protein n=1 Tax=Cladobotryum mycophilum TaxID=491253 RepID=A0ABR0SGR6_9HYPO
MATFQYPGINLRLRHAGFRSWEEETDHYPIGIPESSGRRSDIFPVREVAMMMLMDRLTDEPNWHEKTFDEASVEKWRVEASEQSEDALFARIMLGKEREKIPKPRSRIISSQAFEFCIAELRDKAGYFAKSGLIPTLDAGGNTIVKADCLMESSLCDELIKAIDTLRRDQEGNIDWHPRSDDMIQDLVHPSMYPFVWNRSPFIQEETVGVSTALDSVGQGQAIQFIEPETEPAPYPARVVEDIMKRKPNYKYKPSYLFGSGEILPIFWSTEYQWLPSNVAFRDDGSANITSYINNLHPVRYREIYTAIEHAIDKAIPAWDQCLRRCALRTKCVAGRTESRFEQVNWADDEDESLWLPKYDFESFKDRDIKIHRETLIELDEEIRYKLQSEGKEVIEVGYKEQWDREEAGLPPLTPNIDEQSLARAKWEAYREAVLPEPNQFKEIDYSPTEGLCEKFKEYGLQVIVKMTSIELTPEKPEFPAGNWQIEGQMNEKICATALFYIDSENVTSSHLSFRMPTSTYINDDMKSGQDRYNYLERVYGTAFGGVGDHRDAEEGGPGSCLQTFGDVETPEGRLLAFPNVFHHKVSSFRLEDPSKPGHQRFLALWLVDPHRRIISTANVPPQQKDWWVGANGGEIEGKETPEGLMTDVEAKEHRLKLMDVRAASREKAEERWRKEEYHF